MEGGSGGHINTDRIDILVPFLLTWKGGSGGHIDKDRIDILVPFLFFLSLSFVTSNRRRAG